MKMVLIVFDVLVQIYNKNTQMDYTIYKIDLTL